MTDSLDVTLSELSRTWRQQGITVGPPAPESALRDFEAEFRVILPGDFARYLSTVGGMPDQGDWDTESIRFWPLTEIAPVRAISDSSLEGVFLFADYLISSHTYGIRLSPPRVGEVSIIFYPGSFTLAHSFTEFLRMYLEDPTSLFQK
jgi:hypothetical protein